MYCVFCGYTTLLWVDLHYFNLHIICRLRAQFYYYWFEFNIRENPPYGHAHTALFFYMHFNGNGVDFCQKKLNTPFPMTDAALIGKISVV